MALWARGELDGRAQGALAHVRGLRAPAATKVAVKAGLAVGLAVWVATEIGLTDPYWAGISAVVVMSPTLGASVGAAVARVLATVVGLLVGVAAVEVFGQGYVVAGAVVALLLVLLPLLRLEAGARLGAATSLLVTIVPGSDVLSTAFARGANVPLGCVIAIAVGVLLWPARARTRLRERLCADVRAALESAAACLNAYAAGQRPSRCLVSPTTRLERAALLRDAARETVSRQRRAACQDSVASVDELSHSVIELHTLTEESSGDRAGTLLANELRRLAAVLRAAADACARNGGEGALSAADGNAEAALDELRHTLDRDRVQQRMVPFPTDELMRLLAIANQAGTVVRLLGELETRGGPPEESASVLSWLTLARFGRPSR